MYKGVLTLNNPSDGADIALRTLLTGPRQRNTEENEALVVGVSECEPR